MQRDHVSFSEVLVFSTCQFQHHLIYRLGKRPPHTIFSLFGTAVHEAIEEVLVRKNKFAWLRMGKQILKFCRENNIENPRSWVLQGFSVLRKVFAWILKNFPKAKVLGVEVELDTRLSNAMRFVGFIDLILQDQDGKTHIIDFKTSNSGWSKTRKSSKMKNYQVLIYKKVYSKLFKIREEDIETHYLVLAREKSEKPSVELVSIPSEPEMLSEATEWFLQGSERISRGLKMKNRGGCEYCSFNGSELCP